MTPNKYIVSPPEDLHPLSSEKQQSGRKVYPDFDPWSHTELEDKILLNFVSKGFYNSSKVNFESISARSSLQESLPKVSDQLANQFSQVLHIREQDINKISSNPTEASSMKTRFDILSGPGFALPNRVTLTDQKRELWLRELSSPHASLTKLSKSIPHGFKRRQILEQCYIKHIPMRRAIWLIKYCYASEWKSLASKQKSESTKALASQLYKEWTENMVHIMEKLVFEMAQYYNDSTGFKIWRVKVSYYLKLLGNCYTLGLLDKNVFHHWLVELVGKVENFEFLPLTLHILSVFWDGICGTSEAHTSPEHLFLINRTTEVLLHKYYSVSHSKSMISDETYLINDVKKNNKVKETILGTLKNLILKNFHEQSLEAFIMPNNNWDMYKPCLYEMLEIDKSFPENEAPEIKKKLELITYRNDSLKFNSFLQDSNFSTDSLTDESPACLENIFISNGMSKLRRVDPSLTSFLDNNSPADDWGSYVDQKLSRIDQVVQMVLWAITPSRKFHYESCQLVAKLLLLKINAQDNFQEFDIEDTIWMLIFQFSKLDTAELSSIAHTPKLHQLLNVFIGYGLIKVPTYIKKLISSGTLYLSDSQDKYFHCELLTNLKISPLMKSQYNMVLKNVMEYEPKYYHKFHYDKLLELFESSKSKLLEQDFQSIQDLPLSVKIMVSDWYLNYVCSPSDNVLKEVNKDCVILNFKVFCIQLNEFHHFYKWIEFIVYHQLLMDIETLEVLIDILLYYEKFFPLLINDHVLFMKTILHIYLNEFQNKDHTSYEILRFNKFWKFFNKSFTFALELDSDLQAQLLDTYEAEKSRTEKLSNNTSEALSLFHSLNEDNSESKMSPKRLESLNFPGIFQQNLKNVLNRVDQKSSGVSRKILLLLMAVSTTEYNKFMSIFLKRKDFKQTQLINLISLKLLTLELVHKVLGDHFLLDLLTIENYDFGLFFEYHKNQYIETNFKSVLEICKKDITLRYTYFLDTLMKYGICLKKKEQTFQVIYGSMKNTNGSENQLIKDLLQYGTFPETEDDRTIEEIEPIDLFESLNFTNVWIFQIFVRYCVDVLGQEDLSGESTASFITEIVKVTNYDPLSSRLFDEIFSPDTIHMVLQVFEVDFFQKCLSQTTAEIKPLYLTVVIEVVTSLSRKLNKNSGIVPMGQSSFALMEKALSKFENIDSKGLQQIESILDIYLKIFIVHQKFIFKNVVQLLQRPLDRDAGLISNLCLLFDKTGFNLKLKLLLYDILSSLKSFIIYESTRKSEAGIIRSRLKIPEKLLNLPPFHISSFVKESGTEESLNEVHLGIVEEGSDPNSCFNRERFFIFDKQKQEYISKLVTEPFQLLENYQDESTTEFNSTSLSMSLFNASFDRKNPT